LAGGFAFLVVGVDEIVVELEVSPEAGGMARKFLVSVFSGAAAGDLCLGQAGFLRRLAEGFGEEIA
jgi:hypothetical protein